MYKFSFWHWFFCDESMSITALTPRTSLRRCINKWQHQVMGPMHTIRKKLEKWINCWHKWRFGFKMWLILKDKLLQKSPHVCIPFSLFSISFLALCFFYFGFKQRLQHEWVSSHISLHFKTRHNFTALSRFCRRGRAFSPPSLSKRLKVPPYAHCHCWEIRNIWPTVLEGITFQDMGAGRGRLTCSDTEEEAQG